MLKVQKSMNGQRRTRKYNSFFKKKSDCVNAICCALKSTLAVKTPLRNAHQGTVYAIFIFFKEEKQILTLINSDFERLHERN